jgi:hypothetical protein
MNTNIRARKPITGRATLSQRAASVEIAHYNPNLSSVPKTHEPPPGSGVRALCAAFLIAPVILGVCLSSKIADPLTLCSHWLTLVNNKKISAEKIRPVSSAPEPVLLSTSNPNN